MERRNQFRVFPTATLLSLGKCMVVDWKAHWVVGIQSLYWIRFLNVPLIAIVVWIGYLTARMIAPERIELRMGVPLLACFIPQNMFYTMNNDVLSPLCFGVLFLCVLQWLRAETPRYGLEPSPVSRLPRHT